MQKEKVRVYILARELDIDTAELLRLCKSAGFDVKNQLSSLEPDQQQKLEEMVKKASKAPATSAPVKPVVKVVAPDQRPVPNLAPAKAPKREESVAEPTPLPIPEEIPTPTVAVEPAPIAELAPVPAKPAVPTPRIPTIPSRMPNLASRPTPKLPPASAPAEVPLAPVAKVAPVSAPPDLLAPVKPEVKPTVAPPVAAPAVTTPPARLPPSRLGSPTRPLPDLLRSASGPAAKDGGAPSTGAPARRSEPPRRTIGSHLRHLGPIAPPQLKQMSGKPASDEPKIVKPIVAMTKAQVAESQQKPITMAEMLRPQVPVPAVETEEEDEAGKKDKRAIPGRQDRQKKRNERAEARKTASPKVLIVNGHAEVEDEKRRKSYRHPKLKHKAPPVQRPKYLELEAPVTVRVLSEQLGIRSVELMFKLQGHGAPASMTINSAIDNELAHIICLEYNCDLKIVEAHTAEEEYLETLNEQDSPESLVYRAPIVTVMGHVDHGKTSLLDRIRKSNIVDTEAGGITQVIRAWRVEHGNKPVTFLDTPGHEAFTKMRARGAQVTDIAVIVVAADDGVMPQTEEAINHAKAAGVSLVIAINKVDMPSANLNRTRQQLYGLNVLPDNMGGDTPFVETSAVTGKGIDELLDQLAVVAELKELKANPNKHAKGTCLEANLTEGEGVMATLLVRDGTLRRGDIILCGGTSGRVRQMYNDMGNPIDEAGPSVPVRITGLDFVPDASDPFQVMPDLLLAVEFAENRRTKKREASVHKRPTLSLERLTEHKIDELKVILKADFRGSIEAIRKELDKLQHDEVRVRLLEAGIGAITENDVWLALASPDDTMIVGFNAVPDERAMALADEKDLKIHEYNIIYNLTNDIKAALEGKLKPREDVIHLGRAIVRDTFKISRVGTIAGCYVTTGTIKRNAKVRIIRDGVVIFPPADRSAGLESLKRFKEDSGEVREGFECGIKVAGYDDIKTGDVIEAYRVEHVLRTLE